MYCTLQCQLTVQLIIIFSLILLPTFVRFVYKSRRNFILKSSRKTNIKPYVLDVPLPQPPLLFHRKPESPVVSNVVDICINNESPFGIDEEIDVSRGYSPQGDNKC